MHIYVPHELDEDHAGCRGHHFRNRLINMFTPSSYYSAGFHELQGELGLWYRRKVAVHFIDDNHLILKISRHIVFEYNEKDMPDDAPEIFTYYGIRDS